MTDPIRDAAQALIDAQDSGTMLDRNIAWTALRRVLSAPQPAAAERVKELMKAVDVLVETVYAETIAKERGGQGADITEAQAYEAVESSARALLVAGREEVAALQAQIAELEARQEWVPVANHLPPKNTEVLICFAGQNTLVSTGQWTGSIHDVNGWCYPHENRGGTDSGDDPVVTHWQYAPEVPTTQPPEGR